MKGEFDDEFLEDNVLKDPKKRSYPKFSKPHNELNCAIESFETLKLNQLNANDTRMDICLLKSLSTIHNK